MEQNSAKNWCQVVTQTIIKIQSVNQTKFNMKLTEQRKGWVERAYLLFMFISYVGSLVIQHMEKLETFGMLTLNLRNTTMGEKKKPIMPKPNLCLDGVQQQQGRYTTGTEKLTYSKATAQILCPYICTKKALKLNFTSSLFSLIRLFLLRIWSTSLDKIWSKHGGIKFHQSELLCSLVISWEKFMDKVRGT